MSGVAERNSDFDDSGFAVDDFEGIVALFAKMRDQVVCDLIICPGHDNSSAKKIGEKTAYARPSFGDIISIDMNSRFISPIFSGAIQLIKSCAN